MKRKLLLGALALAGFSLILLATGIVDPGSQGSSFTLRYRIPQGADSFRSTLFATARAGSGETYLIPAPYPGA